MRTLLLAIIILHQYFLFSQVDKSSTLPVKLDELSTPQFTQAIEKSVSTCIIPLGILEKHGPHLPLSTDLIVAREISLRAASKEYTLVYPPYYFGQIFEAQHQAGTIAYSSELIFKLLDETCQELSRNGIKKIILVNGHGGNNNFLNYFCQAQLASKRDYVVVLFSPALDSNVDRKVRALRKTDMDMHAGETETSMVFAIRPDLVKAHLANNESGEDLNRLADMPFAYSAIWWYAKFPNHYAGNGSNVDKEIGELLINGDVNQLIELIKYLKNSTKLLELQNEFYNKVVGKN